MEIFVFLLEQVWFIIPCEVGNTSWVTMPAKLLIFRTSVNCTTASCSEKPVADEYA